MTARFSLEEAALAASARVEREGAHGAQTRFDGVFTDTRKPAAGALFVALSGENHDGAAFAEAAARAGAAGVLVPRAHAARISSSWYCGGTAMSSTSMLGSSRISW